MNLTSLAYALPLVPFISRLAFFFPRGIRHYMSEDLAEEETDRESHRMFIRALSGFSFSVLTGMSVVERFTYNNKQFQLPIFYLLISFLFYLSALNLQGYKYKRWHDQLGDALVDSATLSLLLSIISIIWSTNYGLGFRVSLTILTLLIWLIDHAIRLRILWRYLSQRQNAGSLTASKNLHL